MLTIRIKLSRYFLHLCWVWLLPWEKNKYFLFFLLFFFCYVQRFIQGSLHNALHLLRFLLRCATDSPRKLDFHVVLKQNISEAALPRFFFSLPRDSISFFAESCICCHVVKWGGLSLSLNSEEGKFDSSMLPAVLEDTDSSLPVIGLRYLLFINKIIKADKQSGKCWATWLFTELQVQRLSYRRLW